MSSVITMTGSLFTPEAEYAKDFKIKKEDILTLMEWASKQPHLPKITEYEFIQFYHCVNYSLQAAKDLVDMHYEYKNYAPELFPGPEFNAALSNYQYWNTAYTIDTRKVTEEKNRVIFAGILDANKFHIDKSTLEFTKVMFMLTLKKGTCPGYVFIFDMKGLSLNHLSTMSLALQKKYLYFIQEAIPLKIKELHIVNGHYLMERILMLLKPFINKELYESIFIHTDYKNMYKSSNILPDFIPSEIGGTLSIPRSELIADVRSNLKTFENEICEIMTKRSDRKKRLSESKYSYNVEILNGSFRKLEVD